MTKIKIFSYLTVVLLFSILTSTNNKSSGEQSRIIDSLKTVIQTASQDTTKIKALNALAEKFITSKPDTALVWAQQALELSQDADWQQGLISSWHNIGYVHYVQSNYPAALKSWTRTLELREQQGDWKGMAGSYNNIGIIYLQQSSYPQALEYYFKSLKIYKALGEKSTALANSYNNIRAIYRNQSFYPKALEYYFKSFKIYKQLGNKKGMALSYNNMGIIYYNQSSYPQALEYYIKALNIYEDLGEKSTASANSYNNIGVIYKNQSSYPHALGYYFKALKIFEKLGDKKGIALSYDNVAKLYTSFFDNDTLEKGLFLTVQQDSLHVAHHELLDFAMIFEQKALLFDKELSDEYHTTLTLSGIGSIYVRKKEFEKAIEHFEQAFLLADSIGALQRGSVAHSGLAECYEHLGNHKLALEHYKQFTTLQDSVFNEEKSKDIGKLEARHEMEMAEIKRKQEEEEQERILEQQTRRRHLLQYSGILIFIVAVFITLLFSGRLNIPVQLAKGGVFFTFLIVFEFLLVLIDPYIEQWTGGEPTYKLMVNASLAGLFLPLHNFAESKLRQRLFKTRKILATKAQRNMKIILTKD